MLYMYSMWSEIAPEKAGSDQAIEQDFFLFCENWAGTSPVPILNVMDYLNISWTVPVLLICPSYLIIHKKFPAQGHV
jgi:hypothetical protein